MKLLDKINLLLQLNRLRMEVNMLAKLKGMTDKLDGLKSVLGLLAVVAYYAAPQFGVHLPDLVLNIGSGLAGVGLVHKLEKGTGLLSKGLDILAKTTDILSKAQDVAKKTEEKLKEKEGEGK